MKELSGNLITLPSDATCVTTNGFVKANGHCVMGRGCAKQLADKYPELPLILGRRITHGGNHCHVLTSAASRKALVSFPVKPIKAKFDGTNVVRHMAKKMKIGDTCAGWMCKAELSIIERSARELVVLADKHGWSNVLVPRAGCGAGELKWEVVRELLQPILDDRFTAITF